MEKFIAGIHCTAMLGAATLRKASWGGPGKGESMVAQLGPACHCDASLGKWEATLPTVRLPAHPY